MSVRRLADESVQPERFAFNRTNAAAAKQWIRKYPKGREASAVIPLLMIAQEQEGWVTRAAIEHVAAMLDMPLIRVLEVATFYTQFQLKPVGTRAHVQVCGTTPCMLRGSEALMDVCRRKIHHDQFHTNASGTLSWEEVECLGACVNAPMVMIFKDTYEDLTSERLEEIIDEFEAGRGDSVKPGPQNGRVFSAPQSGLTTLKDEKAILKSTRDKDARQAGKTGGDASVPPSKAAKPKTYANETAKSLQSPSAEKASLKSEAAKSAPGPAHDPVKANQTVDDAGAPGRQRRGRPQGEKPENAFTAPEASQGDPVDPAGKRTGKAPAASLVGKQSLSTTGRPKAMKKPTRPDDLKLIGGIGPRIERILNDLGIYKFAQIAAWTEAERDWVDSYLNFRGRIGRDQWVRQADALARGGEAEYLRVFGKKPR